MKPVQSPRSLRDRFRHWLDKPQPIERLAFLRIVLPLVKMQPRPVLNAIAQPPAREPAAPLLRTTEHDLQPRTPPTGHLRALGEPALRRTYVDLLEEAERIRSALAALASQPHEPRLTALSRRPHSASPPPP